MATRTINSPGVEIREKDLSLIAPPNVGTNIFVPGFANQGPIDEVIKITTREELDLVYGRPTNSAERYFYYTVSELLNSPANIYTSRLPYGEGNGVGFGSRYSALAYPVRYVTGVLGLQLSNSSYNVIAYSLTGAQLTIVNNDGNTRTIGFSSNWGPGVQAAGLSASDIVVTYTAASNTAFVPVSSLYLSIFNGITANAGTSSGYSRTFSDNANSSVIISLSSTTLTENTFTLSPFTTNYNYREVSTNLDTTAAIMLSANLGSYVLGEPTHIDLTDQEYRSILDGSAFDWQSTGAGKNSFSTLSDLGKAGLIVLNKAQTTITDQYEGYYVGLLDNSNINPGTEYNGIVGAKTVNTSATYVTGSSYLSIPDSSLSFKLSSTYTGGTTDSVSLVMENLTNYDINGRVDDDLLNVGVFKLRKSIFANQAYKLDYSLEDGITGSINYHRTQLSPTGGPNVPMFLETRDSKSRNISIMVNDYVSDRLNPSDIGLNGVSKKRVRCLGRNTTSIDETITGLSLSNINTLSSQIGYADSLFALGSFSNVALKSKSLGNIPTKISRALDAVRNDDIYDIDVVLEGGLGTINVGKNAYSIDFGIDNYDEFSYGTTLESYMESLRTSQELNITGEIVRGLYHDVFSIFESFCSPPYDGGGRGDCIFIADILRHIAITGQNNKIINDRLNRNFQKDIYWAIRHQFELANSSYAAVYAQWGKVFDSYSGKQVWVPFSGFAGASIANSEASTYPWIAPAGFTRGIISTSTDYAINPNQKQRDELYKSNINPVSFFPSQGTVIFGQKTLLKRPSAFDRINVRRLFLALERPTKKASQFFVFEPNTVFTRTRLVNVLTPIFERAKATEGLYDYLIVCDERNNTGQVIDQNELVVDIYIKPVRSAEFILVNFYATRTDANFQEILGA